MSDSAPFPPPNSPLEIARHELGHAFMAQHLGKTVRLITILDPSLCLHEPDAKAIIERDEPLSDSDRTRIGEDLKITVAGPVATALSREQSEAKIRGSTGLTSLGGASDAYRFCWAAKAADDLDDPLERLEALYCVRVVNNPKRGGSGRPSGPTIYLNPKLQGTPNNIDKKDKPPSGGTPEPLSVDFVNENGGGVDELSEEDRQYLDDQRAGMQMEENDLDLATSMVDLLKDL